MNEDDLAKAAPNPIALVGDDIESWRDGLRTALPREQFVELAAMSPAQRAAARIAIVTNPAAAELDRLPQLEWVHSLWAGVDQLIEVAQQRGFSLTRLVDPALAATMAEATLAWSLYLSRYMPEYREQQSRALWQELPYRPAADWRVSVLGTGELGLASARRLQDNGFRVSAWGRTPKQHADLHCVSGLPALDQLLSQSDIAICLLPLTPATRGLLNAERLAMLAPSAALINFARGPIVVDADLVRALKNARLRHAVLDVFDEEPLAQDNELWRLKNVSVLPHVSAPTPPASATKIVAQNITTYRATQTLPDLVDLEIGY